jgi:hypothetical protein
MHSPQKMHSHHEDYDMLWNQVVIYVHEMLSQWSIYSSA